MHRLSIALLLACTAGCAGATRTPTDFAYECEGLVAAGAIETPIVATFLIEGEVATFASDTESCAFARSYGFNDDFGAVAPDSGFGCPAVSGGTIERTVFENGDVRVGVVLIRPSAENLAINVDCELVWER